MTGKQIEALRKRMGLSRAAFAERLGVSRTLIWRWEKNKREPGVFAARELERIARRHDKQPEVAA